MKFLFYLTFALSLITLSHADIKEKRAKASKIYTTGNFKEALEIYKECLKSTSDANSSIDLDQAIKCFQNIHQVTEIDEFVEHTLTQHKTNFHVHTLAAKYYLNTQHYGVKIDEKFLRGNHHHNNGTRVNSTARDRVNTLILYEKAESLISTTVPELSESRISTFYINYANAYFSLHQTFKFQALTDTSKLPDYEENYYAHWHRPLASAAPTTKDGTPIFYSPPKTFEQAINDGERWRFLLQKAIEVNSTEKNKVTSIYADFLQSQFGVQTLNSYSWFRSYQFDPENEDKNSILTLYTLADDETTARLASGAKRFKLPDEHNFLKLHQELFENEYTDGRKLSEIYLNRMQFDKAEAILKEAIERDNRDHQKELLNNIINDWARFDVTSHSFPAGTHPNIGIVYRNVKSAELEIRKIDTDKLYQSTINFLKENPLQLDWQKLNITNLSQRLQNGSLDSFISDQAINKKIDLNPKEGHWDTRADISIPIEEAGAYQVKITLPNGKTIKTFAWLDSITVVRNSTQKGNLYSVTDSVTGKPIEGAKLEFFGYRQEYLNNRQDKRRYNIFTKKKEFVSDQNGQILTAKQTFECNYNWSIKATHKNSSTFTSFNRHYHHYNSSPHPSNTRSFAVTDRPVYLPGQKVYGKFWYRTASYTQGDISNFANQDFTIHIKDSQGQDVGKAIKVRSDEYGGIEYELELTEDAKLGSYAVSLRRGSSHKHVGSHYFRVEKYKKPEFEVKVESPSEPVKLGETFEATIKANYYHGAPVSKAKVKVKVMPFRGATLLPRLPLMGL